MMHVHKNFGDTICVIKVNQRRTDNIIAPKKKNKTLHRKLKVEQQEPH